MDAGHDRSDESRDGRFNGLIAEARAALAASANTIRAVREQFRESYMEELARWERLRDELIEIDGRPADEAVPVSADDAEAAAADPRSAAAAAAEAGADDARRRALRFEVSSLGSLIGRRQAELGRLELAISGLERTWLFLEHDDTSLVSDGTANPDVQMRIVEAQEAERARLAQEVHDGPAQALANAVFQTEYIERVMPRDIRLARTELRYLREILRRELGDVRSFITQLRPPIALELGLEGAIREAGEQLAAVAEIAVEVEIKAPGDRLSETEQTVVLRVAQEALQNVRKHAAAKGAWVTGRLEDGAWIMEIRDDGRGFDVGAILARGRRNFGLQFMRERADLIGASFEVRSGPDRGTLVRLAVPLPAQDEE